MAAAKPRYEFCPECECSVEVMDDFMDSIGYEEQERPVHVIAMECGHDIVTEARR